MKNIFVFVFAWLLFATTVQAQSTASATTATAGARRVAEELVQLMQFDKTMSAGIDRMLEMQIGQNAQLKNIEPELRAFLTKYMSAAVLKDDIVALYAREFSESELKDLVKFYRSPTGQKFINKQPLLMQQGMEIGQKRVQEHLPELRETIEAKMKGQEPAEKSVK